MNDEEAPNALRRPQSVGGGVGLGASPMMSDVCLVPQMYNARRFDVEIDDFPRLVATDQRLRALDAFARAAPGEG